jgi:predicted phosphodiesterase
MQIAVISDLHLGARDGADSFGHQDSEFLRFLGFLERNFERIVLLGDIWETLAGAFPGGSARELERARTAHPEVAARFRTPRYTYVHGNHDLAAAQVDGAPESLGLEADGTRMLFTHGHQNDGLLRHTRFVSELGVWMGGWMRRLGLNRAYDALAHLDEPRQAPSRDGRLRRFERWAVNLARARNADVVVTGHTHRATRAEHGSRLFLNSGSCSRGEISFVGMDTRRGEYAVHGAW